MVTFEGGQNPMRTPGTDPDGQPFTLTIALLMLGVVYGLLAVIALISSLLGEFLYSEIVFGEKGYILLGIFLLAVVVGYGLGWFRDIKNYVLISYGQITIGAVGAVWAVFGNYDPSVKVIAVLGAGVSIANGFDRYRKARDARKSGNA